MMVRIARLMAAFALVLGSFHAALAADDGVSVEVEAAPYGTPALYVGVFGGYNIVFSDWDLNTVSDEGSSPNSSPMAGLRLGIMPAPWIAFEISASFIPFSADRGRSGLAAAYRGDVHILAGLGTWVPYAGVGAGVYQGASGDLGSDADWEAHWELGLKANVASWGAARLEARHSLTDSNSSGLASLGEITLGFDFFLYRSAGDTPPDTDGDGVGDYDDRCPRVAGARSARGCPDADGDGVDDERDSCVDKPGPKTLGGCPDTDNDGLADDIDRCPDKPGKGESHGCPSTAPDSDLDGIPDDEDGCPDEAGIPEAAGCPDSDGDGIIDGDDRCPMQAGTAAQQGCLPPALQPFSGIVRDVQFVDGKADLTPAAKARLDLLAAALVAQETLRVEVAVHGDDQGDVEANRTATQDRADVLKQYLVGKGVPARRITAIGYGGDRPITDNKTAKGRAENRRVEVLILPN